MLPVQRFFAGGALIAAYKRFSLLVIPFLASFLIILSPRQVALAQTQPATVRVMPALLQLEAGQTGELTIEVMGVQNLYGFELQLGFSPNVVEVVDADPNVAGVQITPGNFLEDDLVEFNEVENTTGALRFSMTQESPSEPKSGSGVLVRLQVHGLRGGASTPINLANVVLTDRDGADLPFQPISGRVEVGGTPEAQPTNTLAPTQSGTPGAQPSPSASGSPEPTQPGGYPEPESPTPPPPGATEEGGYPAAETATFAPMPLPGITRRPPTEVQETLPVETSTQAPTLTATAPAAQPQDSEGNALLETLIVLIVILILALGAIFIFLQLSRGV